MPEWALASPQRGRAVTAAARVYQPSELPKRTPRRGVSEAWELFRTVPELHYVITQQARLVSRISWDATINGNELESDASAELLAAAFGDRLDEIIRLAMIHLHVSGGYWLARVSDNGGTWRVFSDPVNDTKQSRKIKEQADVLVRVWQPDPVHNEQTDSPVLASLDIARELILARAQARAQARNRTAQLGILIYPRDGVDDPDTFESDLTEVMTAPLADERSAAVAVPNLVGFNSDLIEKWRTLDISNGEDAKLTDRIERLVRMLAIGLDAPPEILLGMADVNHWSSWSIDESNWLGHVQPYAMMIGDGIARALEQATGADADTVKVTPDPAELLKRRPTIADALGAFKLGLVNGDWARQQIGADAEDAPTPEELARMAQQTAQPQGSEGAPANAEPALTPTAAAAEPLALVASPLPVDVDRLGEIDAHLLQSITDMFDLAVERALTRVGNKIKAASQHGDPLTGNPADLAVTEDHSVIPNLDEVITAAVGELTPQAHKALTRGYAQTRAAGVDIYPADGDLDAAGQLFATCAHALVMSALDGKPLTAATWTAALRVRGIAGGNGDPLVVTAAVRSAKTGVALGVRALDFMQEKWGLVSQKWQWVHSYAGRHPHPAHQALAGTIVDHDYVLAEGINWYPGDHDGCCCWLSPILERIA